MSSGGDTPDTHTKEIIPKMDSKDQVDHADLSSQRASEKVESSKDCEGVTSKTESDSGFKDPSTGPVSQTDPNLDGSDEDLHLQWEDDDMDEQETVTKPTKTGIEEVKDAAKDPNIDEEVNENLLLESSGEIENTEDLADKIDDNSLTLAEDELLQADDDVIEPDVSVDSSKAKKDIKNAEMDKSTTEITLKSSNDNVQNVSDKESIQSNMRIDESKSMEKNDNNHLDTNDESIANIKSLGTSSPNESLSNTTLDLNLDHKLNRPDAMLEIPTQEIIDILDDSDLSVSFPKDDDTEKEVIGKTIDTPEAMVVTDEEKIEDNTVVLNTAEFEVDLKKQVDKEPKLSTVSEDDWTEIERRLEKFETSIVDETESNKVLTSDVVITEKLSSEVEVAGDGTIETNPSTSKTLDQGNSQMEDIETVTEQRTSTSDSLIEKVSTSETIKDVQTNEDTVVANVESQTSVNVDQTVEAAATEISNDIQMSKPSLEKEDNLLVKEAEPASDVTPSTSKTEHMESDIQMDVDSNKPVDESLPIMETDEIAEVTTKLDAEDGTAEITESKDDETSLKLTTKNREKTFTKDVAVVESCPKSLTEEIPVSSQELSKQDTEVLQAVTSIIPIPEVETSNESSTNQDTVQLSDKSSSKPNTDTDLSLKPAKEGQQTETNSDVLTSNTEGIDIPASSILKQETELEPQPSTSKGVENQIEGPQTEINSDVLTSNTEINDIPASSKQETEQPSTSKDVENQADVQLSTKEDFKLKEQEEVKSIAEVVVEQHIKLSSSMEVDEMPSTSKANDDDVKPSTSAELDTPVSKEPAAEHLAPDSSDEVSEVTDSLGLLAESSRVMEDDEEQEDDDDDDDDFYPEDESSNQMTAEHSEDSNQQHSETETKVGEKETDPDTPQEEKGQDKFNFDAEEKIEDGAIGEKDGDMEVETVVSGAEDGTEKVESDAKVDERPNDDEYESGSEKKTEEDESVPEEPKQDIETVKLSDTSDTEEQPELLTNTQKDDATKKASEDNMSTPKATKQRTQWPVMNYVDLEESSSEDDIQEVEKDKEPVDIVAINTKLQALKEIEVTDVSTSEDKLEETKPLPEAPPNVLSVSLITVPEPNAAEEADKPKHKFSLEIFNLDSDEEDSASQTKPTADKPATASSTGRKCITPGCTTVTGGTVAAMCAQCATDAAERTRSIINGIKDLTPLLDLDIGKECTELVEISDSESEDEAEGSDAPKETIGEGGAAFIEAELAKAINETWFKFKMDSRLTEAQQALDKEMQKLEEETKEIDTMLNECQVATDQLRNDLYATFEQVRHDLNPLIIYDTPTNKYVCLETTLTSQDIAPSASAETRAKRRMSAASESSAKRPAIPLGYAPLDPDKSSQQDLKSEPAIETTKMDDDKDIAVLKVSAEAAPLDLPPPGELTRPPLRADGCVYAMRNTFGSWARARVLDVQGKGQVSGSNHNFTICRVRLVSRNQNKTKLLPARCLAYPEPADVRMTIGTRVIALFKDPMNIVKRDTFYSGIVAEVPNPVNNYRYLVFFDDGYAQYVNHRDTRLVCECSPLVWEEVHPFSREFVRQYLTAYPERPMVRLHAGQSLTTEWNGKWWTSRVIQVDASLVQVHFEEDNRTEWIYRGSTRLKPLYLELQAAERHRARPMPRTKAQARVNQPYVEYTRSDEQSKSEQPPPPAPPFAAMEREIRQRAVAKKSTTAPPPAPAAAADNVTSRVVYYTPKNAVKPYKMTPHTCGPHCKRKDTLALKDLRTYNPLAKPLLSGWERQIVRYNGHKEVMYRAPCGRRLRDILELHRYLRTVQSDMAVDLFDFTPQTHCLAEFVLNKCLVGKKDLSHGKENVPVPCVNYYDESLPEFCSYNTERTPTAGVPLNLDPEFLCGCDCTDDCEDKKKCACWQMTLEGARTIGLHGANVGYVYKRLPEPLPSGIYECNSRCKCKQTCLNRVAQHPLQLKLQVFKTLNRGWGIRALNDVPKGSFLCVYAGNLLTDATANMDGLNEGDEYLAELDYIEVVEQMKEGFEEDVPEKDKRLDKVRDRREKKQDKKNAVKSDEPETSSSEDEEMPSKNEEQDGDFCPGNIGAGVTEFSKRLRKRERNKKEKEEGAAAKDKEGEKADEDCITISDDEEVREPSRFMAQVGMESSEFISKYRSVRSYFGKDEACYIMDAKVQGNIGRYLNHSCMPNVFVQNVFVDTHDPRFPWVAFFALTHIKAGTELTWNYNYDVGSVPGKALYCYCGAPTCRGRLL